MADEEKKEEVQEEIQDQSQDSKTEEVPADGGEQTEEKKEEIKAETKEPKAEEAKPEKKPEIKEVKKEVDVSKLSKDAIKVMELVEKMSVLELAELVKVLEDKFGVSAAAPVAVAAAGGAVAGGEAGGEEKSEFNINITSSGSNKIAVIKAVRGITTIGLKEAKDLVESLPKVIKEGVKKEEAEEIKKKLEEAGATVELQ